MNVETAYVNGYNIYTNNLSVPLPVQADRTSSLLAISDCEPYELNVSATNICGEGPRTPYIDPEDPLPIPESICEDICGRVTSTNESTLLWFNTKCCRCT